MSFRAFDIEVRPYRHARVLGPAVSRRPRASHRWMAGARIFSSIQPQSAGTLPRKRNTEPRNTMPGVPRSALLCHRRTEYLRRRGEPRGLRSVLPTKVWSSGGFYLRKRSVRPRARRSARTIAEEIPDRRVRPRTCMQKRPAATGHSSATAASTTHTAISP